MLVRKYVDRNGLAAILAAKRLAGVTPQVDLGIPLHAGNKACKRGIHPVFETQGRRHQNSKIGVSLTSKLTFLFFFSRFAFVLSLSFSLRIFRIIGVSAVSFCSRILRSALNFCTKSLHKKNSWRNSCEQVGRSSASSRRHCYKN